MQDDTGHVGSKLDRRRAGIATLECRDCHIICELVVSPWRCLKTRQPCIYAFNDNETTYFGCVHKVFAPELDLDAFERADGGGTGRSDPYGCVRISGVPRAECPVTVERAHFGGAKNVVCVNPEFVREAFVVRGTVESVRRGWEWPYEDQANG